MRSCTVLVLVIASVALCSALPNADTTSDHTEHISLARSQELAVLEQRNPIWVLLYVATKVTSAISWSVATFGLVASAYSVAKDCVKQFSTSDCVLSSLGLVFSAYTAAYKVSSFTSSKLRVRSDDLEVHGIWEDPSDSAVTHEVHIPLQDGVLFIASMASENNGTWAHHATRYFNGEETHHLLYRRAVSEDLGHENDGSYHHYRVQDAKHDEAPTLQKRLERRTYKVVSDYLWKNNGQSNWQEMHNNADLGQMSDKIGKYFQDNKIEAGCVVPVGTVGSHGGTASFGVDQGVLAYGWNDKPFDFNGRSSGWLNNDCKY